MSDLTTGAARPRDAGPGADRSALIRQRPLRGVRAFELRELLDREVAHWRDELCWDFSDVAAAVAEGLDESRLDGCVLLYQSLPVGYCYTLEEGRRLVVGSVFVDAQWRNQGLEERMVGAVLERARGGRALPRIEGQTLFCTSPGVGETFQRLGFWGGRRHYMVRATSPIDPPRPCAWRLAPMARGDIAGAAELVHRSHIGSPDAEFNSTYATAASCREFVESIVLRCGCGTFNRESSFVAHGQAGLEGVILCTTLGQRNGHICQVSVLPGLQGRGLGRRLMEQALLAHYRQDLEISSLSVTVSNSGALRLYEHLGFQLRKVFEAYAWSATPAGLPA